MGNDLKKSCGNCGHRIGIEAQFWKCARHGGNYCGFVFENKHAECRYGCLSAWVTRKSRWERLMDKVLNRG